MPYLNLDLDYFANIKTRRLVGLLGKGSEVLPLKLWCACGKYRPETGSLTGYSAQEIESLCEWWGKSGAMVEAMQRVGFLDLVSAENGAPPAYAIHDWAEHAGHLSAFKRRARAAAQKRWASYDPMLQASLWNATSNAPTVPVKQENRPARSEPLTDLCGNVEIAENTDGTTTAGDAGERSANQFDRSASPAVQSEKSEEQKALEAAVFREPLFKIHDNGVLGNLGFWAIAEEVVREAAGDIFGKRGFRELRGITLDGIRETAWLLLKSKLDQISKVKPAHTKRRGLLIAKAVEAAALAGQIERQKGLPIA